MRSSTAPAPDFRSVLARHRDRLWVAGAAAAAVACAYFLPFRPWLITGAILGCALLALTLLRPLAVVGVMLMLGAVDLSFLTGGFKSLFGGMGGLDMNGIRLIGMVISVGAIAIVDREVLRHAVGRYGRWYLLFLAYAAATLVYSPATVDGLRLLLKLAYPFLIFVAVLGVARTPDDLERLANWALVGAAAISLVNPLSVMAGGYSVELDGRLRLYGLAPHQNPFSFYMLVMLLMAFTRYTVRGQLRYLALCAGVGIWIVLTLTRVTLGAVLVGLTGLALYDAIVARRWRALVGGVLVGAALALPLVPIAMERSFGYVPSGGELLGLLGDPVRLYRSINLEGREIIWPIILKAFLSSPILGLGLGASTAVLLSTFGQSMGGVVHNEYLRLATDTGVVGMALFAGALMVWWVAMLRVGKEQNSQAREFALPAFAGIVAWSIVSVTDNAFDYYAPFTQYVGFLCAGALAAREFGKPVEKADAG